MGKLAKIKTAATNASVEDFIGTLSETQQSDSKVLLKLLQKATGEKPKIWGKSIVGFGEVRYKSPATGREVDWFKLGFSPRKTNLSIYLMGDMKNYAAEFEKLGKHKTGVGCLYINKLSDVDVKVLEKVIAKAAKRKI